jgi:DNA repair exonuclease SbcCD ATPase subunit
LEEKVGSLEGEVKQLKLKESENKGVSEKLSYCNKRLEEISREKEELMNESINRMKQINDVNFKYEKILKEKISTEENLREMEFNLNKLNENNRKIYTESNCLSSEIVELKKNNENQEILISTLKEKKLSLEAIYDNLQNKHNELRELYNQTVENKNKSEATLTKITEEFEKLKKSEKENYSKMTQQQNELNELKLALGSCTSVSRISLQKLRVSLNQEDNTKVFSEQFVAFYSKFYNYLVKPSNDTHTVKFLEDWTKISSFELDV